MKLFLKDNPGLLGKVDPLYVPKGWGYERWYWNSDAYCGKLLFVAEGRRCSWHYHNVKDETFLVLDGSVEVVYGTFDEIHRANHVVLHRGEVFHMPAGVRHQLVGRSDTHIIEFSTRHTEEDSIRLIKGD